MQVRRPLVAVRRIAPGARRKRSQSENIWLRTKRHNASGKVVSGTGGVCYPYFPAHLSVGQREVLAAVGVR
jgi:hypothetical protein